MYDEVTYQMALEMLEPALELNLGKGLKVELGATSKEAARYQKEGVKLHKAGKYKEAVVSYNKSIDLYNKVIAEAQKIPDESFGDWVISLCLKPSIVLLAQIVGADYDLKGLTRQSAVNDIKKCSNTVAKWRDNAKAGKPYSIF